MDQLWALKKEFDAFRWFRFGLGVGKSLSEFRCTFYCRPYCEWPCKVTWDLPIVCWEKGKSVLALQAGVLGWIL
jgi:hypothetical protein